ncbi:MAG TPA: PQQ-dependent sugar dehydrogenase [Sphingomonas sp.]|uniref:PQQ-dependent sugar dehydrogenase n=1 Tax=Sphingomonas sp. TaxID=28214 RepID=UPI002EDA0E39
MASNQAPLSADGVVAFAEDATHVFSANDFAFTDADGHALRAVVIGDLPLAGVLYLTDANGVRTALTPGAEVTAADVAAGRLSYVPQANGNGVGYASFTFRVRDDGGSADGGSDLSAPANVFTFDVTAVGDAPTRVGGASVAATAILEDAVGGVGQSVLSLFGDRFADADGDALGGVAVIANGSSDAAGHWEFLDGGVWTRVGAASADAAVVVTADTALRFTPAANFNGAVPELRVHLFDGGAAVVTNGAVVDLDTAGTTGGSTSYSSDTLQLTGQVSQVNDAPVVANMAGDVVTWRDDGAAVKLDLGGDAGVSDVDVNGFEIRLVGNAGAPVFVAPVPDGTGRVFVLERAGRILIQDPDNGTSSVFLDVRSMINLDGERGLLGFATAPDFAVSGKFFIYSSDTTGNQIRSYSSFANNRDLADPSTGDVILSLPRPGGENIHNGGWLGFGPDGYLYATVGDGSYSSDPDFNAVNPNSLAGKLLRLDVSGDDFADDPLRDYAIPTDNPFANGGGLGEVFAMGFRNPYRASIDPTTGTVYIGDVGLNTREEIDVVTVAQAGTSYGWSFREGTSLLRGGFDNVPYEVPSLEYDHGRGPLQGNSVTGGYVYNGPVESLRGKYIFGDFITGNIWAVDAARMVPGVTLPISEFQLLKTAFAPGTGAITLISSFGVDEAGNLYVTDFADSQIYRVEAATEANFGAGQLRVAITANGVPGEDRITIDTAQAGGVTLSNGLNAGSAVRVGGVLVGTVGANGNGANGNPLVIDLSSEATQIRTSLLMNALSYFNVAAEPTPGTRTLTYTLVDGAGVANGGGDGTTFTTSVQVLALNDAPGGADARLSLTEDGSRVLGVADFGFADVEGDAFTGVVIAALPAAGGLSLDGTAVTPGQMVSTADIAAGKLVFTPAANGFGDNYASFTFRVADDGGTTDGGVDVDPVADMIVFDVAAVDDAPVARPDTIVTDEASPITGTLLGDNGSGVDGDVDGPALAIASVNGAAASVGQLVELSSGALLRVEADGTFRYDPNGAFDALPGSGSGATNSVATDSFTYALVGGTPVTVAVTVNGLASAEDTLLGSAGADMLVGSAGNDIFFGNGGRDVMSGGAGDDLYIVDSDDRVIESANNGRDTVSALSSYVLAAGAQVEVLGTINGFGTTRINLVGNELDNVIYGNAGDNGLNGAAGNDQLFGQAGNDFLEGQAGEDYIEGGVGLDRLIGGLGNDVMVGGADDDGLLGQEGDDELYGQDGTDYVDGGIGRDRLYGGNGADLVVGAAGQDALYGQDGDDELHGQGDEDYLDGGAGDDRLYAGGGADIVLGGSGRDSLQGQDGADFILGQDGDDYVDGGLGEDALYGDAGADVLVGAAGNDQLYGGTGEDYLTGREDDDYLDGGAGRDLLLGDAGADTLVGGTGDDQIYGGIGNDFLGGREDDDYMEGGAGDDLMLGDGGADVMVGGAGADGLYGGDGNDQLYGREDGDYLDGAAGSDLLNGDAGDDILIGRDGADDLRGGEGADLFVFTAVADSAAGARDQILDFNAIAGDRIDLVQIDADSGTAGNDAFTFIGTGAFTNRAGELRYELVNGQVQVLGDVNGDGVADLTFMVSATTMSAGDFLL